MDDELRKRLEELAQDDYVATHARADCVEATNFSGHMIMRVPVSELGCGPLLARGAGMSRRTHGRREVNSSANRPDRHERGPRGGPLADKHAGRRSLLSGLARSREWLVEYDGMSFDQKMKHQARLAEVLREQEWCQEQLAVLEAHEAAMLRSTTSSGVDIS